MSEPRLRTLFRALLAIYVAWGLLYVLRTSFVVDGERVFTLWDDAMVSMRYARNLANGHGLVWNPGAERVQGYSNLGVTLLMAGIHLLPIGPTRISLVFQLFNLGLLVWCVHLVRDIARSLADSDVAGWLAGIVFMACAPIAILSLQGTDVGVITALLLGALRTVVVGTRAGGAWPTRIYPVLALGIVVRLDFAMVYVVFAAASLLFPRPRGSLLVAGAVFAATLGGILAFQHHYYGDLLPNTYYLKATGSPLKLVLESGVRKQKSFVTRAFVPLAITVAVLRARSRKDRRLWLLGGLTLALFAYDVWSGGDWIDQWTSRFGAPALPLLIVAVVVALSRISERPAPTGPGEDVPAARLSSGQRFALVSTCAVLSIGIFNTTTSFREWCDPRSPTMYREANVANYRLAQYLGDHTRKDASVAVHWAGILPYFLDRYTIDVLGKCDRHIARMTVPRFHAGHSKWSWHYVLVKYKPDIFDHASRGLDARPDFVADYLRASIHGEDAFFRKESLDKLQDPSLVLLPVEDRSASPDPTEN